ncbi:heterokaryon incompatibility protein-domain-containing protein [Lasiosphaeria ovina]|uniref:Heterokaryon incompatibility protein-domain-containing protein n=1 Tax=Lasiosphaeria ovina TaxID=92902 RepID=A0AAE0N9Z1_9PEZI|nr:heterokaryon incompatibility protein-domain-containing protein [Lasiosphaeria ovina]
MLKQLSKHGSWPFISPIDFTERPTRALCPRCRHITAEALASEEGYKHVSDTRFLQATRRWCGLCYMLYERHSHTPNGWKNLRLKLGPKTPVEQGGGLGVTATWVTTLDKNPWLWKEGNEAKEVDQTSVIRDLYVSTPIGDPAAAYGIPVANRSLSNTRSEETFNFIRSCLEECRESHSCSLADSGNQAEPDEKDPVYGRPPESQRPLRLIDVDAFKEMETLNKEFVRLVINHRGKISTYMALSHCWGVTLPPEDKTVASNLADRLKGIRIETLAKNFIDAIEVTRRMGVRYLWIDALCIVQDSQDDWASESVKMGSIYEGSLLTIAASVAGHSSGGCFNHKSVPHDHLTWGNTNTVQSVEITNTLPDGKTSTLIFHLEEPKADPQPLKSSPLNSRGWTYQERVLSPRTIHFAASQAVWECRELYRLEDLLASPLPRWYNSFVKNTFRTKAATVLGDGRDRDRDPVRFWYNELVSFEYSRREFTRPADRLIALAGLASIWNKQRLSGSDTYLAGIWLSRLAFGLAWERKYRDTYSSSSDSDGDDDPLSTITAAAQQQQPQPRRPTWSWTSHDGHVSWQDSGFTPAFYLEFLHSNLEYLGSASSNNNSGSKASEFSPVVVGYIAVRGLVAAAPLDTGWPLAELRGNPPDNIDVDATLDGYPVVLKMDYRSHPQADDGLPLPLYALALGDEIELQESQGGDYWPVSYVLIVTRAENATLSAPSYLRAGLAFVYFPSAVERAALWGSVEPRELHLF